MKKILLVMICLGLAGCATTAGYQQVLDTWIGHDAADLTSSWGYPSSQMQAPNGNKVYVYNRGNQFTTPMQTSINGQRTPWGYQATAYTTGGQTLTFRCNTFFEVDSGNKIIRWRWEGNACRAVPPAQNDKTRKPIDDEVKRLNKPMWVGDPLLTDKYNKIQAGCEDKEGRAWLECYEAWKKENVKERDVAKRPDPINFIKDEKYGNIPEKSRMDADANIKEIKNVNERKDGPFKTYFKNGQEQGEGTWNDGKLEGAFKIYSESGQLKLDENYQGGERNGTSRMYHENGQLEAEVDYKGDKIDGTLKGYYKNGQLKTEEVYKDGKTNGPLKSYYENGQLKKEGFAKDGISDGSYKLYYENGKVQEEGAYKEGKSEGASKMYYSSGQLKSEGIYKDDKPDGAYINYYENGKVQEEGIYKNGIPEGPYKMYYESGQLKQEGTYKDGKIDGKEKIYQKDGSVAYVDTYINGGKVNRKSFDAQGKLTFDQNY